MKWPTYGTIIMFGSGAAVSFLSVPANYPDFVLLGALIMSLSPLPMVFNPEGDAK